LSRPRIAERIRVTVFIVATASYNGVESSTRFRPTSPAALAICEVEHYFDKYVAWMSTGC
jgi:hypothetical protein